VKLNCPNCGIVTVSSFTIEASPNYRKGTCPSCGAPAAMMGAGEQSTRQFKMYRKMGLLVRWFCNVHAIIKRGEGDETKLVERCLEGKFFGLIKCGVNDTDDDTRTPLHSAIAYCHLFTAAMLLDRGADVNAVTGGGWTPLDFACDPRNSIYEDNAQARYDAQDLLKARGAVRHNKFDRE